MSRGIPQQKKLYRNLTGHAARCYAAQRQARLPCVVGMNDDDEFLPYEEESNEEEETEVVEVEVGVEEEDLSDEAFLRGQTDVESDSGWETGGDTDAGFSDADAGLTSGAETDAEGEEDLFPDGADPLAMLQGMEENRENDEGNQLQPYELLARQRRLNRHRDLAETAVRTCSSNVFVGLGHTRQGNTSC